MSQSTILLACPPTKEPYVLGYASGLGLINYLHAVTQ